MGAVLAAAFAALLFPSSVGAQTSWRIVACDGGPLSVERTDSLLRALALEVDGALDGTVTVALDCPGPSAQVTVVLEGGATRVEREVALGATADTLHDRVIALVVANAVDAARTVAGERPAPPEPVVEPHPEPTVEPPPEALPRSSSVTATLASPRLEPLPPVTTELALAVGGRVFVADGATALVSAQVSVRWESLLLGIAVAGVPVGTPVADIDVVVPTLQAGAVFRLTERALEGSVALLAEGGLAVTQGRPRFDGYRGTTEVHPVLGATLRLAGAVRLERAVALGAAIDLGGVYGVQVAVGRDVVAFVHGLSFGVAATLSWAP